MSERCPAKECGALRGHHPLCPLAPAEYKARQTDHLYREAQRWRERYEHQRELTNVWHGRYEVLRHENNKLRRKLNNQS